MISLILIFGFLCRSSIFRYPDDLRNIVQQCARSGDETFYLRVSVTGLQTGTDHHHDHL